MKKLLGLSMALMMFASCAVGCGDDDDDDTSKKSSKNTSSSVSEDVDTSDSEEDTTEEKTTEEATTTAEATTAEKVTTTEASSPEPDVTTEANGSGSLPQLNIEPNTPIQVNGEIAGKWEAEKIIEDGKEITEEEGIPVSCVLQFEFKGDGNVSLNSPLYAMFGEENIPSGKWTQNGNIVTVDIDNEALDFELKNDRLVAEEDGDTIYLMKVEKFTEVDLSALFGSMDLGEDE